MSWAMLAIFGAVVLVITFSMLLMCQDSKEYLDKRREKRAARKRGSERSDSSPSRRVKKTWATDMRGS